MKLRWHGSNHAGLVPYIYTDNISIVQFNYLFVIGDRDGNQFDTSEYCAALPTLDIILTVIDCLRWWESQLKGQLTAEVIKIVVDSQLLHLKGKITKFYVARYVVANI